MKFKLLISTALIMTLASCGGADERKAAYMEKAKSSIKAGDLEKARIELKNVLQIDPKDGEAYYELGKVYEQTKDYRKAFANYNKAEELNPDLLENQARLGRFYLLLVNDIEKAQEKIDFILSKDPVNTEGLLLKAALLLKEDKKPEAVMIGQDIITRNPGNADAVIFVASMYLQDKDTEQAIDLINTALKIDNDNDRLNNLLATVLISKKDYAGAEAIYENFIKKFPDDRLSYNRLAALYDAQGDKDKAEVVLRSSIGAKPDDAERYLALVKYINQIKGIEAATSEMKLAVANNNIGRLRLALGEILLLKGDKQSAIDVYTNAITDFPEEVTAVESAITLSSLYFNDGEYEKASKTVDAAIKISPNDPKLNLLNARIAIHDNNSEKAILSLRVVTKATPDNIDAYFLLVNAYALESNVEQINNTLNSAFENNKNNPDALLKLSKYYLASDFDRAETVIDSYNKLKESDYEGMSIKAMTLNKKGAFSEAYGVAEKLIKLYPEQPNGYLQVVPYLNEEKKIKQAIITLERGYINTNDNRKILLLLTRLDVSDGKLEIAEKRVADELKAMPEDNELKLLLSEVYLASNKIDSSEVLLKELVESKPDIEEPYLLLSQIYLNKNDLDLLDHILIKGKNNVPKSYKIPLKLAAIYEKSGAYNKAIDVYRDLYQIYPDNLVVINNLASLISDHGDVVKDLQFIEALVEKLVTSNQPVFLDTIGWVYYRVGNNDKALSYLQQTVEKSPEINVFNYHLGMAYKMSGDKVQAKVYLEKSVADKKPFIEKAMAEAALKDL